MSALGRRTWRAPRAAARVYDDRHEGEAQHEQQDGGGETAVAATRSLQARDLTADGGGRVLRQPVASKSLAPSPHRS
jgi:hypothetical protein